MKLDKILVPTDLSSAGDAAFALAVSLARDNRARLLIAHVEEPAMVYGGGEMFAAAVEPATEELRERLKKIVPPDPEVAYEHHLVTGEPAEAIVRLAESEQCDLIVMGTHGRKGLSRLLMGSVAEAVVRRSHCPVMTLRPPHPAGEH